jgi:hypothetical protein
MIHHVSYAVIHLLLRGVPFDRLIGNLDSANLHAVVSGNQVPDGDCALSGSCSLFLRMRGWDRLIILKVILKESVKEFAEDSSHPLSY